MGHVIAVVGLKREAAVLRGLAVVTVAGGGASERLRRELAEAAEGADGIISFGMAGALAPELRLGDWVIGERVGDRPCDPRWSAALRARLPRARMGAVFADGRMVANSAAKAELYRASGALAADMESHIVAAVATERELPFAVLRCISDEAGATLPPAIAVAMKPGGGLAISAVVHSIMRQPSQLPQLIATGAAFNRAYKSLGVGARQAGPRLALPRP